MENVLNTCKLPCVLTKKLKHTKNFKDSLPILISSKANIVQVQCGFKGCTVDTRMMDLYRLSHHIRYKM